MATDILSYGFSVPAGKKRTRISQFFPRGIILHELLVAEDSILGGYQVRVTPIWAQSPTIRDIGDDSIPHAAYDSLIGGQSGQSHILTVNSRYVSLPLDMELSQPGHLGFIWENIGAEDYVVLAIAIVSQRLAPGDGG